MDQLAQHAIMLKSQTRVVFGIGGHFLRTYSEELKLGVAYQYIGPDSYLGWRVCWAR